LCREELGKRPRRGTPTRARDARPRSKRTVASDPRADVNPGCDSRLRRLGTNEQLNILAAGEGAPGAGTRRKVGSERSENPTDRHRRAFSECSDPVLRPDVLERKLRAGAQQCPKEPEEDREDCDRGSHGAGIVTDAGRSLKCDRPDTPNRGSPMIPGRTSSCELQHLIATQKVRSRRPVAAESAFSSVRTVAASGRGSPI